MSAVSFLFLDRPSPNSYGVVPFVARYEGVLRVYGVPGVPGKTALRDDDAEDLIRSGHALNLIYEDGVFSSSTSATLFDHARATIRPAHSAGATLHNTTGPGHQLEKLSDCDPELLTVLWRGSVFAAKTRQIDGCPQIEPGTLRIQEATFDILPYPQARAAINRWIAQAAQVLFRDTEPVNVRAIAQLMQWADPFCDETKAALVAFAETPELRARELEWQVKIERDAGKCYTTVESLRARHEGTIERYKTGAL